MGAQASSRCCCASDGELITASSDGKAYGGELPSLQSMGDVNSEELVNHHAPSHAAPVAAEVEAAPPRQVDDAPKAPRSYEATIIRNDQRLGIEIVIELVETDTRERASVEVTGVVPGSVVAKYNDALKGEEQKNRIEAGHFIMSVNGKQVADMSSKDITKEFQSDIVRLSVVALA
mmetsp:Transcript_8209/g.18369  ORF Transcript_8209/g.18369 Transcript_8209/m.18369 type:complete len:176 (-) Transcript_8209:67-594(-)|eukprot:CAMPEP_0178422124 /NCGR_PEP_ID=MMETSP0689_2-20121128/27009_1 /TAXON_ID=160604 /ORGANISM="Amphidinium massartii, Strain CS-259" /LENGTH=175 /DNA_ID=CAMNT_0020043673 /DNA_START=72 /DNA_END=599 /DNA_ORIENTATION=-